MSSIPATSCSSKTTPLPKPRGPQWLKITFHRLSPHSLGILFLRLAVEHSVRGYLDRWFAQEGLRPTPTAPSPTSVSTRILAAGLKRFPKTAVSPTLPTQSILRAPAAER